MNLRRAAVTIALAALPVVALATPAHAVSCNLVADPVGDAGVLNNATLYTAQTDIVTADLASGATNVAVVIRVVSLDPNVLGNLGSEWAVGWEIDGTRYGAYARQGAGPFGTYRSEFTVDGVSAGPVAFAVDVVNDTITWTVSRSLLPDLATPGATFTNFVAGTKVLSGTSDVAASATATYVDQSPSCVPVS